MLPRLTFWPGLLLGGCLSFGARRLWMPLSQAKGANPLLDLVGEAVIVCDASGVVTYTNAAANLLFGPDGRGSFALCYPSGQPVPPGQLPLSHARRTGRVSAGARYSCLPPDRQARHLEASAHPLNNGGAVAIFRDITSLQERQARDEAAKRKDSVLSALCRRLSLSPDTEEIERSLVESALSLIDGLPGGHARLYLYNQQEKQLTRLASAPEERPKRPRSQRQSQSLVFPFDANSPLLWQVYVARLPFISQDVAAEGRFNGSALGLGEETTGSACAVPLLAGGVTLGHLSLTCQTPGAFAETGRTEGRVESLVQIAACGALALAERSQVRQTEQLARQMGAMREIVQAVADRQDIHTLADVAAGQVRHVLEGEVCLLALSGRGEGRLRLAGEAYRDALLFPERHAPDDPALIEAAVQEAVQTGKTVRRVALPNPSLEAGNWRAFAGQSGRHSILSVPLQSGQGALTLYRSGETGFTGEQVQFMETLAALVSTALPSASRPAVQTDS